MISQLRYTVTGEGKMHCSGCESRVRNALQCLEGVQQVLASAEDQTIALTVNTDQTRPEQVEQRLQQLGYEVQRQ